MKVATDAHRVDAIGRREPAREEVNQASTQAVPQGRVDAMGQLSCPRRRGW